GRPNSDVIRKVVNATAPDLVREQWMVDFPPNMDDREASLYEFPFQHLARTVRQKSGPWWINPHVDPAQRAALTRRERFLATPIGFDPAFKWFSSELLPDSTLLVIARDDDFSHGLVSSRLFGVWWHALHSRRTPTLAVDSFPFPWAPSTPLSSLTRAQEEFRHALARAARSGDRTAVDDAVFATYQWPNDLGDDALVERLAALNRARADQPTPPPTTLL
ncbi:MAG: hypothetical protein Q8J74_11630, partial [Candidatus Didemnitutus sp.]|nr:hypothetical protein [Candidatus Didemnitutus sp.]